MQSFDMRAATVVGLVLMAMPAAFAGPIEDTEALHQVIVEHAFAVADAIEAPVSRPFARELDANVYQPIVDAVSEWESKRFASGNFRTYGEFEPCLSAGQLLGYVADEVIQHHLGNDQYEGTMKYRHFEPFAAKLEQCGVQIEAARAEAATDGQQS